MDSNQRNRVILLGALGVLVLGVIWFQFFRTPGAAVPGASAVAHTTQEAVHQAESVFQEVDFNIQDLVQSIKEVDFDYAQVQQVRDPLAPLVGGSSYLRTAEAENGAPTTPDHDIIFKANRKTVTGIVWDAARPMAVLSEMGEPDEIVGTGYEFGGGIVVKEIEPNRVVLSLRLENETTELVKELKEQ